MLRRSALALRSRIQAATASAQKLQIEEYATKSKGKAAPAEKQTARPKPASAAGGAKGVREEDSKDKKFQLLLKGLTPTEVPREELTPEQHAEYTARAKAYSRRKMQEHRAWQRDLSRKIQLKEAALAVLPPHLRDAAEQPDMTPFPADRQIATHTPPIKGFGDRRRAGQGKQ